MPVGSAIGGVGLQEAMNSSVLVDEITVTQDEQPKDLELLGHVFKARPEEDDLTDTPEKEMSQKYAVYKLKKTLYVQVPKSEPVCAPMVRVS